jgi:hypothetical protein
MCRCTDNRPDDESQDQQRDELAKEGKEQEWKKEEMAHIHTSSFFVRKYILLFETIDLWFRL